ncbi:MAG: hypothetical protein EBY47_09885 [Actinobacteria bacterium]|nr:hypothetical protein [Actinomycetota bacterium]
MARVVMGSAAVRDPDLVDEVSATVPVAVGLDHRGGRVALDGWTTDSDLDVASALAAFPAAEAFVVTDISRDGALSGPDLEGLLAATSATDRPVIANIAAMNSGYPGVRSNSGSPLPGDDQKRPSSRRACALRR